MSRFTKYYLEILRIKGHIFFGYVFLTLLLTYPAFLKINTHIIGHGDAIGWIGFFSWFDIAIFDLGVNPLHNSYVFYPIGMDIVNTGFVGIILAPITHIVGPIASYNLYVLSTFIFAGFGTYLLVKHLTNDEYASFIAGIIFAFSPVHFAHALGHMHIMSIQWIPFFVLYLIKMFESVEKKNIYYCALFFSLIATTSWTMAVISLIFSMIFIYDVISKYRNNKLLFSFFKRMLIFLAISLVLIIPFAFILIKNMVANPAMVKPLMDKIVYSADVMGFFIPSPHHPIFGVYTIPIYRQFTGNFSENTVYIGYTTLFFASYAFLKIKNNKYIKLFSISSLIFFVLSLGPVLHIYGKYRFTEHNLTLMLPQMLLNYMPVLSMIRCPSRISIMLMLMLAVLGGYGISEFFKKIANPKKKQIFAILITLLIISEFAFVLPSTEAKAPEFYQSISNDGGDYAILELPIGYSPPAPHHLPIYHFYQSVHEKKLVGGAASREGIYFRSFIRNSPLQPFWQFETTEDIITTTNHTKSALSYYNIRYVILHKNIIKDQYINNSYILMETIFDNISYYEDDYLVVYEVPKTKTPFMVLDDGWHGKEMWENTPTRWMENNGTITIVSNERKFMKLNMSATSFYKARILEIYLNGVKINTSTINGPSYLSIPLAIEKGENSLIFYSPEGTDKPSETIGTKDERDISIAFQYITIL